MSHWPDESLYETARNVDPPSHGGKVMRNIGAGCFGISVILNKSIDETLCPTAVYYRAVEGGHSIFCFQAHPFGDAFDDNSCRIGQAATLERSNVSKIGSGQLESCVLSYLWEGFDFNLPFTLPQSCPSVDRTRNITSCISISIGKRGSPPTMLIMISI